MEAELPSMTKAVDRVLAVAHVGSRPSVAVIGRHALPVVLALLRHGCTRVRSLRPDAAAPDCERADIAWILDVGSEQEFDDALRAAHRHAGQTGLDVVSVDPVARRVMLASRSALAMAA